MPNKVKLIAFTLAEVLITLGIIGVVCTMTIPNLMHNIQDAEFKTAYKKAFSAASQAVQQARAENLFTDASYNDDNEVHHKNFVVFMDKFKVAKKCINNNNAQCWEANGEDFVFDGYPYWTAYAFIDNSGVAWSQYEAAGGGWTLIDTNGFQKPNQWGKDRFGFHTSSKEASGGSAVHNANVETPDKVTPFTDNHSYFCWGTNKCATEHNYFGTSWLYN